MKNENVEFILAQNISDGQDYRQAHKYRLYYNLDNPNSVISKIIHKFNNTCFKFHVISKFKSNYVLSNDCKKMKIYQGCAQFGLTKDTVEYIVNFHDLNEKFNRFFKTMYEPDESYFHTIIYNSKF